MWHTSACQWCGIPCFKLKSGTPTHAKTFFSFFQAKQGNVIGIAESHDSEEIEATGKEEVHMKSEDQNTIQTDDDVEAVSLPRCYETRDDSRGENSGKVVNLSDSEMPEAAVICEDSVAMKATICSDVDSENRQEIDDSVRMEANDECVEPTGKMLKDEQVSHGKETKTDDKEECEKMLTDEAKIIESADKVLKDEQVCDGKATEKDHKEDEEDDAVQIASQTEDRGQMREKFKLKIEHPKIYPRIEEAARSVDCTKPFTAEQLRSLYYNAELEHLDEFVDAFLKVGSFPNAYWKCVVFSVA